MGMNIAKLSGTILAGILLAACQNQATPPAGANRFNNPSGRAGAAPTALPTRVIAATTSVAVDGVIALSSPTIAAAFQASGNVTAVHVTPGQSVKLGDVLAEIDATDLNTALQKAQEALALQQAQIAKSLAPANQTDVDTAKASLNAAYAAYNDLKKGPSAHDIEQALRSWNEAKNSLYSAQIGRDTTCGILGVTDQEAIKQAKTSTDCKAADLNVQSADMREEQAHQAYLDAQKPATQDKLTQAWSGIVQAQTSLAKLEGGVDNAQKKVYNLQLKQAQLAVDRAQRNLAQTKLLSPCDCVVQAVTLSAGASSAGGSIVLLDTKQLKFRTTNLNEQDVIKLRAGQTATLRLKAFSQTFNGKVSAILPLSSGIQGSAALFTAIIDLDPAGAAVLPGMTGQAEVALQ